MKKKPLINDEDKKEIQRLAKVAVATHNDCESIYHLFKKYVNEKAPVYRTDCSCYSSIGNYWQLLMQFYSNNHDNYI